jgi:Bacterial Ig-like domain (group 3)
MRRMNFRWLVATVLACICLSAADAGGIRRDIQGTGWTVAPNTILQQLPPALGFPRGLQFGVFGQPPVTVDKFSGPTAVTTVRQGFTLVKGAANPAVLVLTADVLGQTFDAQGPLWWVAPAPPAPVACPASPALSYYACPGNLVSGLKIEWGAPAQEQLLFFNLGSPHAQVPLYDAQDYNCSSKGLDDVGNPCNFDKVGTADDSWELSFNCDPTQPAGASVGGCSGGAALQFHGMLYTASAALLNSPSALNPGGGAALNEFVYNDGKMYAPPGWRSFYVTFTALSGPKCQFVAGTPLNFYSLVVPVLLNGVPTGTATLVDGTTVLATATLNSYGVVTFTTTLGAGSHSISVAYNGNSQYAPSQSNTDVLVSQGAAGTCN